MSGKWSPFHGFNIHNQVLYSRLVVDKDQRSIIRNTITEIWLKSQDHTA